MLAALCFSAPPCCGTTPGDAQATPLKGARGRPSIVLVSVDTLRADRLGPDGPMPRLTRLASKGLRFTHAHALVPLTLPSHATLLTGLGPLAHGVRDNIGYALPAGIPTVAEALSAAGYSTGAFVGGYPLDGAFGLSRGFDLYDDRMTRSPPSARSGHTERRAGEVVDAALGWVRERADEPIFLWVHLFDPHDPYEAPPPFQGGHPDPYDDEVAYADHALGRLLDSLDAMGVTGCWIFVTGDHGESLGEHGEATHGVFLYESTLRVPLVVVPPHGLAAREVAHPVSLRDVAPSILEAAGLPPPEGIEGHSFLSWARSSGARAPAGEPVYLESIHGRRKYGWAPLHAYLDWPLKYIAAPRTELYDLEKDPAERRNLLVGGDATPHERILAKLRAARERTVPEEIPEADIERLSSLGYVGGSGVKAKEESLEDRPRPDPKERITALPPLERGLSDLAAGRLDAAREELEAALRLDPQNLVTLNNLGIVALRQGKTARAVSYFRDGLRGDRAAENLANNLGIALARLGRHAEAAEAYRRALEVRPGFTAARFNLALALHREGLDREALAELERVQEEEPDFPELQATLAEVRRSVAEAAAQDPPSTGGPFRNGSS